MQHLAVIADLTRSDAKEILDLAASFHEKHSAGCRFENILGGKVVALIFEKPSLRTKVAFEVAAHSLGGCAVFLSSSQILASGNNERGRESIPDIARNLERFADLLLARVYNHETIQVLCRAVRKPVVNALCDRHHPTQALADLHVIRRLKGLNGVKVAFSGDGNNVATSLMQLCALLGVDFSIATPAGYEISPQERTVAENFAAVSGSRLIFTNIPQEAVAGADVVYTDTFVSMGQEDEKLARLGIFMSYQVNRDLMQLAKQDAIFMHCLPAHRGEEVTDEVMDSEQSIIFDQAESRLHVAKALLAFMLGERPS